MDGNQISAAAFYNVSPFIFVKKDNFVEFLGGLANALALLASEYELTHFVAKNIAQDLAYFQFALNILEIFHLLERFCNRIILMDWKRDINMTLIY